MGDLNRTEGVVEQGKPLVRAIEALETIGPTSPVEPGFVRRFEGNLTEQSKEVTMIPTQAEFEAMLGRLREGRTESPLVDGKEDLLLDTEGDRAHFIRHVAALANNVEPSYLIIGLQDRTWKPVGLDENSPLRNADETQRRMNQALTNRVDPGIFVRYRTSEVDGTEYGLVAVHGAQAPYIIAIEDREYGGQRSQAAPGHIYRGAIYVRQGANSVVANRQRDVLGIIDRFEEFVREGDKPDDFMTTYNYADVEAEDFGHHPLTDELVEIRERPGRFEFDVCPAESWASFVFCPKDMDIHIDTVELKNRLKPNQRIGRGDAWYRRIPKRFVDMFYDPSATPREFLCRHAVSRDAVEDITHFVRIRPSGHIEIACTYPLLLVFDDGRRGFRFVCLVGYLWQMTCLSQAIYESSGYYGRVSIPVNLIGTKDSWLADYARSQRGGWSSPFHGIYVGEAPVCQDPNVQIQRELALVEASDDDIEAIVREIAKDIGAYYRQEPPRCFDCRTDQFPDRQYMNKCAR